MRKSTTTDSEARDALYRVKRGLCGYISYLAACEMNKAFSEYVLYEPILRILTARGYAVECEYECPGIEQPKQGDKKRLDFYAVGKTTQFALEVKWAKSKHPDVTHDTEKLKAFFGATPNSFALLCVFGTKSRLENLQLDPYDYKEWGKAVYADLRKTKYACRIYRLLDTQ